MAKLVEMDEKISIREQLEEHVGHIILINKFNVEPDNSEFCHWPDGSYFLDEESVNILNIPSEYIEIKKIIRRLKSYRGSSEYGNEFESMTVVLTDDGIATDLQYLHQPNG